MGIPGKVARWSRVFIYPTYYDMDRVDLKDKKY